MMIYSITVISPEVDGAAKKDYPYVYSLINRLFALRLG